MSIPLRKTDLGDGRVLVGIGFIAPRGKTREERRHTDTDAFSFVHALLAAAGIQAFIHGSRIYAIDVLEPEATRAAELLRADRKRERYGITVYEGNEVTGTMEKSEAKPSLACIVGVLVFFCMGAYLGIFTTQHFWELYSPYSHGLRDSFGFVFNFGLFRLGEPWSSWLVLACTASFIWAGCSLLRRRTGIRYGVIVGTICLLILALGFIGAL